MVEMKTNWNEMKMNWNEMKCLQGQMIKEVSAISTEVKAMREEMKRMTTEANNVKQSLQSLSDSNYKTNSRKDIVALGGVVSGEPVAFAERFSWIDNKWTPLQQMKENRSGAAAVVFENKILVCGGRTLAGHGTDSIEVMDMNQRPEQWLDFPAKLPLKCRGHKCVVYGNRLLVIGGYTDVNEDEASDGIHEVLLVPPYSSKLLCRMNLRRCYHAVELFNDKILIVGGLTSRNFLDSTSNVEMYDITNNKCKEVAELPSAVWGMATVRWDDNVILMGGSGNQVINTVIAYDIKTGESKALPSMKSRRSRCAAVVSGNKIVVLGGYDAGKYVSTVECFDFISHSWIELPSMMQPRYFMAAV